jgi:2-haloacid dehalogenase
MSSIQVVVFDIGNVLIRWDPRWLFRKILTSEAAVDRFLADVDFFDWNAQHDAGQLFEKGIADKGALFPHYRPLLQAFHDRWEESLGPPIEGSITLSRQLRASGYRTLALTNFSAETFPRAVRLHEFLTEFEGIVVSGHEKLMKPDPAIYRLLCERHQVVPSQAVFIDDTAKNVDGARQIGMHGIHFQSADQLARALRDLGIRV